MTRGNLPILRYHHRPNEILDQPIELLRSCRRRQILAGEVRDPDRNLPRAIIIGTLAIIGIYVAANLAYLYMNSIERVQSSPLVAADTMSAMFGQAGASFISVIVMISTFGSLIGSMLAAPRGSSR